MSPSEDAPLLIETRDGPVATLTLNRPERRNSLSTDMMQALQDALDRIKRDREVKAVVLAANGPAFCAGHDLRELRAARRQSDKGQSFYTRAFDQCSTLMRTILRIPQPVIAQVQGIATAAGCQLVATCDLAVASREARFATPGVNIGLFCSTPMVALSRAVAAKPAMEMLLTGDPVDAYEARRLGLINRVTAPETLPEETLALAHKIAAKAAPVVAIGKKAFYGQLGLSVAEAYAFTSNVMVRNMMMADAEEGIDAFLDKRDPVWTERLEEDGDES